VVVVVVERYGGGRCVGGVENWRAGRETMECEWNGPGRGRGEMGPGAGMYQVPSTHAPPSRAGLHSPTPAHTHAPTPKQQPTHPSTPTTAHSHTSTRPLAHSLTRSFTHPVSQSPSRCTAGRLSGALPKKPKANARNGRPSLNLLRARLNGVRQAGAVWCAAVC
jgi:hypothetical protein